MSIEPTDKTSTRKVKSSKKELNGSASLFASMVEHIPDALIAMDDQFHIIGWNAVAENVYGWKATEALGKRPDEFLQTGFWENGMDSLQAELKRMGKWSGEVKLVRKDGTQIWVWCSVSTVRNEEGEITGLVSISRDITERKQAEEKLRMSETLMAQARKIARLGVWMIEISNHEDLNANPLIWSDEVYFIFGYEPGTVQVTNEFFFAHIHPDDRQAIKETIQKAIAEKRAYEIEYRILHARGIERVVLEYADILFGPDGRPVRILGAVQDITERKWALEAIQQSESHYRALFEDSPVAIWEEDFSEVKRKLDAIKNTGVNDLETYLIVHLDEAEKILNTTRILDVNRAAMQMYEAANKQELIESTVNEISEGEQEHMIRVLTAIAEGRTSLQWEGRDNTMSGRAIDISLSWSVVPGYEQDYSKVIVTTIDITRQQQAIRELQKNQHILHEAQVMAKMGSWTADLRAGTFDVSPENSTMLGLSPGVYPLSDLSPLLHPSDREAAMAALNHSLQTGLPIDVQFRVVLNDTPKWLHTKARIMRDKDGKPSSALGVTQDITERMLAGEQVRISEARFRQLAENLEEAFWITDPAGKTEVYISPAAERIWGRPVEKLLLVPNAFIDTVLPEDRSLVLNALEQQARGERTDIEYRIQRPDGSVRWIWDRSFPILAEDDERHLVAGLAADITDRKNFEARIQQQVQRLSALSAIDNIISASWISA